MKKSRISYLFILPYVALFFIFVVLPVAVSLVLSFAAFNVLEPAGTHWHKYKWVGIAGCYLLMMFYTTVAGWMLAYVPKFASGQFVGADSQATSAVFDAMLASPVECVFWMVVVCVVSILICSLGVQKGVERITKAMMLALLAILGVLVVRALTLPGAADGVAFYLLPDFSKIFGSPDMFFEAAYAAMGQAFFSLSITGSGMIVYGAYLKKDADIPGASLRTAFFDTLAAMLSAVAIIPAVFAYGLDVARGPSLMFLTLPAVFQQMPMGQLFAVFFFLSVFFAGITSLINMFEAVVESWQSHFNLNRKLAVLLCSAITLGVGLFLEAEPNVGQWMDFITIQVVPIGAVLGAISIYYVLGWSKLRKELETGRQKPLSRAFGPVGKYVYVPLTILVVILGFVFHGIG